ncbi:MAG: hypothetical protein QM758_02655 [Armatimonas sp.]
MPLDLNTLPGPIDPTDPQFLPLLANLQGNILKSHGRSRTVNLFLRFAAGKEKEVKQWIGDFTRRYVTSALRQMQEAQEFKANGLSGRVFGSISLSAEGYKYLEVDITTFRETQIPHPLLTTQCFFRRGMKDAQSELSDPNPANWEFNQPGNDIHAVILLADEQKTRLDDVVDGIILPDLANRAILAGYHRENGLALRDERNQPLEHFGYRDGVSQPLFFVQDVAEEAVRFGISEWDPSAPLAQVLIADPLTDKPDSYGSYLVFRKLKQDVAGFLKQEDALAVALGLAGTPAEERAGALVVGRFENGIPVTVNGSAQGQQFRDFNNFNYHNDLAGARCPFQGHIRKTNPRGDTARVLLPNLPPLPPGVPPLPEETIAETDAVERGRRIARRGITFGLRTTNKRDCDGNLIPDPATNAPKEFTDGDGELAETTIDSQNNLVPPLIEEVGLLFQCYQATIPDQFGFMQKAWANNPIFAKPPNTGLDPLIGQLPPNAPSTFQHDWPTDYDNPASPKVALGFGGFVEMLGGEFFFTPSVSYLMQFGKSTVAEAQDRAENDLRAAFPRKASS